MSIRDKPVPAEDQSEKPGIEPPTENPPQTLADCQTGPSPPAVLRLCKLQEACMSQINSRSARSLHMCLVQFWWAPKFPTLWAPVLSEATQVVKDIKQETLAAFVLSAC